MSSLAIEHPGRVSRRAWERLFIAFALSLSLHLALMWGIPVNPTGGVPSASSTIDARLEPATSEAPAQAAVEPPLPDVLPTAVSEKPAVMDPLAEPTPKKPEPQPQAASTAPASSPRAGVELPLIRDPTYYPATQLDVYPRPLAEIERKCPPAADANRVSGGVLILLLIDEFGVVNDASIVESEPEGYFEEYTLSLFRGTRWHPGERQGRVVKSRAPIRIKFIC